MIRKSLVREAVLSGNQQRLWVMGAKRVIGPVAVSPLISGVCLRSSLAQRSKHENLPAVKSLSGNWQIMLLVPPFQHSFPTTPSATDLRADWLTPPDPQGSSFKSARFPRATTNGGGAMAKSEDGEKCVVSGRECEFPLAFCWSFVGW